MLVVSSLFTLFSVSVHALDNENLIDNNMTSWVDYSDVTEVFQPLNITYNNGYNYITCSGTDRASAVYDLTNLIEVGEKYKFSVGIPTTDGINANAFQNIEMTFSLVTVDDDFTVIDTVDDISFVINKNNYTSYLGKNFTFEFVLNKAVNRTALAISIVGNGENGYHPYLQMYLVNPTLSRVETKEEGLLNSIIEWLRQIKDNLTNGFENLKNGLIELKNNIVELPGRIVNGIKNLFVPSSDYFDLKMDDINTALEENLGAVYQVSNLLDEFFTNFNADSTQNVIEVPVLSVDLLGYPFTIGGWSVPLVPDSRLQFLADACKFIIGVLTTFAFLYGLRKKYDEIVGGGED